MILTWVFEHRERLFCVEVLLSCRPSHQWISSCEELDLQEQRLKLETRRSLHLLGYLGVESLLQCASCICTWHQVIETSPRSTKQALDIPFHEQVRFFDCLVRTSMMTRISSSQCSSHWREWSKALWRRLGSWGMTGHPGTRSKTESKRIQKAHDEGHLPQQQTWLADPNFFHSIAIEIYWTS